MKHIALFFLILSGIVPSSCQPGMTIEQGGDAVWTETDTSYLVSQYFLEKDRIAFGLGVDKPGGSLHIKDNLPLLILENNTGISRNGFLRFEGSTLGLDTTRYQMLQWSNGSSLAIEFSQINDGIQDSGVLWRLFGSLRYLLLNTTIDVLSTERASYFAHKLKVGGTGTYEQEEDFWVDGDSIRLGGYSFYNAKESLAGKNNYVLKLNETTGVISLQPETVIFNDYVQDVTLNGTVLEYQNNGGVSTAFDGDVDLAPIIKKQTTITLPFDFYNATADHTRTPRYGSVPIPQGDWDIIGVRYTVGTNIESFDVQVRGFATTSASFTSANTPQAIDLSGSPVDVSAEDFLIIDVTYVSGTPTLCEHLIATVLLQER